MSTTVVEEEVVTTGTTVGDLPPRTETVRTYRRHRRSFGRSFTLTVRKYGRKARHAGHTASKKVRSAGTSTIRFIKRQGHKAKAATKRTWTRITVAGRKAGGYVKSVAKRSWVYAVKGARGARAWAGRGLSYLGHAVSVAGSYFFKGLVWLFSILMSMDVLFWMVLIGGVVFAASYWDDYLVSTSRWMRMKHRPPYTRYLRQQRRMRKARARADRARREARRTAREAVNQDNVPVPEKAPGVSMTGEKLLQELSKHGIVLHWHAKPEENIIDIDPKIEVVDAEKAKQVKLGEYLTEPSDIVNLHEILRGLTTSEGIRNVAVQKYYIGRLEALDQLQSRPEDDAKKVWGLINRSKHKGQTNLGDIREGVRDMVTEWKSSPYFRHLHAVPDLEEEEETTQVPEPPKEAATPTPRKRAATKRTSTKRTPPRAAPAS